MLDKQYDWLFICGFVLYFKYFSICLYNVCSFFPNKQWACPQKNLKYPIGIINLKELPVNIP